MHKTWKFLLPVLFGLISSGLLLTACAGASSSGPTLRLAGAYDVLPLAQAIEKPFAQESGISLTSRGPAPGMQELKDGKVDGILLGREPLSSELQGVEDTVVAYDAVCFILSSSTYSGGVNIQTDVTGMKSESMKFVGLRNLTLEEAKGLEARILLKKPDWYLPNMGYYNFAPYADANGKPVPNDLRPGYWSGQMVWNPVTIHGEATYPGLYDTQDVILSALGFSRSDLGNPNISMVSKFLTSEEERISSRYTIPDPAIPVNPDHIEFDFYIAQVSRRITGRAQKYGFPLQALSIDGVDPIHDVQAIYDGRYPFSRKIHLLVKTNASPAASQLKQFLLSSAGQQLVKKVLFLPLPLGR